VQLYLGFLDTPVPEACVWERLSDEQKSIVIGTLSRVMLQAASANGGEDKSDERHRQG
jgi:hypothetical protein